MKFSHLHLHTGYSLLDGAIRIDELFPLIKSFGMDSCAITDHGNMFGVIEFYTKAKKYEIKPIIGSEFYISPKGRKEKDSSSLYHIVLLAKNIKGYKNLLLLSSLSYIEGFYYKPRIDIELLERYSEGLFALTGCMQGEIPSLILEGKEKEAEEKAKVYKDIFGKNLFFEVQKNGLPEQEKVNRALYELSKKLDVPIVATCDAHYLRRSDASSHDILLCIQTGKKVDDKNRLRFRSDQFYVRSPKEMELLFKDLPQALENTQKISEEIELELEIDKLSLPSYPDTDNPSSLLKELVTKRFKEIIEEIDEEKRDIYIKRLSYELSVIEKMGFCDYFLIVCDFVNYAKRSSIPVGPGRGSAAGSLVSYCLNITEIDPIKNGLIFERFLNPGRITLPDIDVDFCMDGRDKVIEYVREKYGKDNVAQIITFGTMQAKAVVRDVGRALGYPYKYVDEIAKIVPPNTTLSEALNEPRLRKRYEEDEKVRRLIDFAKKLEGLPRHASTHAAGVVISARPLVEKIPLYLGTDGEVITQYAMGDLERVGLVKFDFLGLKTLTFLSKILDLIRERKGISIDLSKISLLDKKTYDLLSNADTTGVFQLESRGMRDLLKRLKPECFEDVVAAVALYRPGPLGSGMVDEFIKRKQGKSKISYILPELEPILKETYGIIVYQEQVMEIARTLADFSYSEADILRRAMGKKKPEEMAKQKEIFTKRAVDKGVPPKKAEEIFNLMAMFAEYGFNKSHSVAYALLAYRCAYLKAHYPLEFMASLLSSEKTNTDKVVSYIGECRTKGINILPPDINESQIDFTVTEKGIRFGLAAVKNVGENAVNAIIEARSKAPFSSFSDFISRVNKRKVNKKVLESLIKSGAFDSLEKSRAKLLNLVDSFSTVQGSRRKTLFSRKREEKPEFKQDKEFSDREILSFEKEVLGFYISSHPLLKFKDKLWFMPTKAIPEVYEMRDGSVVMFMGVVNNIKEISTKNRDTMAFVTLEDLEGRIEVIVFSDLYRKNYAILLEDDPILVKGKVDKEEERVRVVAEEIHLLSKFLEKRLKRLDLFVKKEIDREKLFMFKKMIGKNSGDTKVYFHVPVGELDEAIVVLDEKISLKKEVMEKIKEIFKDSIDVKIE